MILTSLIRTSEQQYKSLVFLGFLSLPYRELKRTCKQSIELNDFNSIGTVWKYGSFKKKKKVHLNSLNHRYFLSRHLTKALASECQLPLMAAPRIKLSIEEVHFRYWSEVHLSNISAQKILLEIFQKQDDSWDFSVSLSVSGEKKCGMSCFLNGFS